MVIKLSKSYPCIYGLPVIHSVDTDIYKLTYYMSCMECSFCKDQCCSFGCDIDLQKTDKIMKHEKEIEEYIGVKSTEWFDRNINKWDHEYPGNYYTRSTTKDDYCVFHSPTGKGCMLHSFALEKNIDYHDLKPFFCTIFPVTYNEGVLVTPEEIDDESLACLGNGPTLYRGARDEIKYYFGEEIIKELDEIEKEVMRNEISSGKDLKPSYPF